MYFISCEAFLLTATRRSFEFPLSFMIISVPPDYHVGQKLVMLLHYLAYFIPSLCHSFNHRCSDPALLKLGLFAVFAGKNGVTGRVRRIL